MRNLLEQWHKGLTGFRFTCNSSDPTVYSKYEALEN